MHLAWTLCFYFLRHLNLKLFPMREELRSTSPQMCMDCPTDWSDSMDCPTYLSDSMDCPTDLSDCMDCPTDLSDDKIRLRISLQILNVSPHYKIFTQIRPEGNVLFYTDKRTAITKPPYVSRNFVSSPETTGNYQGSTPGLSPHQQQLWSHTQRVKRDFTAISNTPILKCTGHEYMEHYFHSPHTPSSQALSVFCSTVHTASTVGLHNSTATTVLRTKQASRRQLCSTGDAKQD